MPKSCNASKGVKTVDMDSKTVEAEESTDEPMVRVIIGWMVAVSLASGR